MRLRIKIPSDIHLRQALVGSIVALSTKLVTAGLGFAVTILIAREFGAAASGIWALALTCVMVAGSVSLCGLDYGSTRAVSVYRAENAWPEIWSWTLTATVILGAAGLIASFAMHSGSELIARALDEDSNFAALLRSLSFAIIPYAALRLIGGQLRGVRRFALAELLEGIFIPSALALLAVFSGFTTLAQLADVYVAGALTGAVAGLAVWFAFLGGKGLPPASLRPREALRRSLPLSGAVLVLMASPWIMTLSLAKFASMAEVGVLRVVLQFTILLGFLLTAVETSLSPQIAALHSQNRLADLLNSTKKMTAVMLLAGGVPAFVLFFFSEHLLNYLGPEFATGATAMRILLVGQIVNLATGPVGSFMAMTGMERLSFRNAVVGTVIVLVVCALLTPTLGIVGAAIAGAASAVYRNLALSVIIWRKHGVILPLGWSRPNQQQVEA